MKLVSIFNNKDENYFRIKIDKVKSKKIIENLIFVLNKLKIHNYLDEEIEMLSTKYFGDLGNHQFFNDNGYIIHVIFGEKYLHLVVKCNLTRRKKLIKVLTQKFSFNQKN